MGKKVLVGFLSAVGVLCVGIAILSTFYPVDEKDYEYIPYEELW